MGLVREFGRLFFYEVSLAASVTKAAGRSHIGNNTGQKKLGNCFFGGMYFGSAAGADRHDRPVTGRPMVVCHLVSHANMEEHSYLQKNRLFD